MTKLYTSGPMSGYPGHNFDAFAKASIDLRNAGYDVEDPADFGIDETFSWSDYLRKDLDIILRVDGIATLPNWECSKGAQLEVYVAQALSMPVLPVDVWLAKAYMQSEI